MDEKFIELKHVQELIKLISHRDYYMDWTDSYEKYDRKVKSTVEWIERNSKTLDEWGSFK